LKSSFLFPINSKPFAELASFYSLPSQSEIDLAVGLSTDIKLKSCILILQDTADNVAKQSILSKEAVARYFSRCKGSVIYESLPLSCQVAIDDIMDDMRKLMVENKIDLIISIISKRTSDYLVTSKSPSLADFIAWDYIKNHNWSEKYLKEANFQNWWNKMESLEACQDAVKRANEAMAFANIAGQFKYEIASKVSNLLNISEHVLFDLLEAPRDPSHGDFSIALPRLRLNGNPAQIAADLAKKV